MIAFIIGMVVIIIGGICTIAWMDKKESGRWPWE